MSVTPEDLRRFGDELLGEDEEVRIRSGVSRSYYACFHLCRVLLNDLSIPLPRELEGRKLGTHESVGEALKASKASTPYDEAIAMRRVGIMLLQFKTDRATADYDLDKSLNAKMPRTTQRFATEIFERVASLRKQKNLPPS